MRYRLSLLALAAALATGGTAAAGDVMQPTYAATVQTTYRDGPVGAYRFNADKTFTGVMTIGKAAQPFSGTFTTDGDTLCVTVMAPAGWADGKAHCKLFGLHAVGDAWTDADGDRQAILPGR